MEREKEEEEEEEEKAETQKVVGVGSFPFLKGKVK